MDDETETRRRSPRAVVVVFGIIRRIRKGTKRCNDETTRGVESVD